MIFDLEKIFEDEFFTICLDKSLHYIQLTWNQHPDSKTFRRGFRQAAEASMYYNCQLWLSDARKVHYLEFAEQNWLLNDMVPLLKDAGLLRFARISSEESMCLQDTDRILTILENSPELGLKTEIGIFVSEEEALEWLLAVAELPEERLTTSIEVLETSFLSQ